MTTLVTGATGFIGGALVRQLVESGARVKTLIRKEANRRNLEGLPVEIVFGDLRDRESLRAALKGCTRLYHVAAYYRLWSPEPRIFYEINVQGTKNILESARENGVERVVYTSTVGTLGLPNDGRPGNEETPVSLGDMVGHYKRSKYLAEQEALRMARNGLPVVIVNPSTPVGPGDIKPTPTGQMIVDFLQRGMPAYIDTGLNLIDVEDVAKGHILAAERGGVGERYILGNQNLTLREIFAILEKISGVRAPQIKLPHGLVLPLAQIQQWWSKRITKKPPRIPLDGVRMAKRFMFFDSSRAVRELGLPQNPVELALKRAVNWFLENGYVRN
ncbi:MAG: NAD-dependent epimerase/dehydratase family protein [candidate division NC10 bacterium]|nr:NAD-dependent epimerase/dehydratase family protein [candidate division NC10 bacterium]